MTLHPFIREMTRSPGTCKCQPGVTPFAPGQACPASLDPHFGALGASGPETSQPGREAPVLTRGDHTRGRAETAPAHREGPDRSPRPRKLRGHRVNGGPRKVSPSGPGRKQTPTQTREHVLTALHKGWARIRETPKLCSPGATRLGGAGMLLLAPWAWPGGRRATGPEVPQNLGGQAQGRAQTPPGRRSKGKVTIDTVPTGQPWAPSREWRAQAGAFTKRGSPEGRTCPAASKCSRKRTRCRPAGP